MARWSAAFALVLALASDGARAACSRVDPEHAAWSAILGRFVSEGRVDYTGLAHDGEAALDAYLATLSGACASDYASWSQSERIAFWLNAYNAFTLRLILDHYPIASIRRIGWLPGAAFRRRFIPMSGLRGGDISLDAIEHETLREEFSEPRIHFALVCAARSCPSLRDEAYRGADLERQLEAQGRAFLRDPSKNRIDRETRTLRLSRIFDWFREDFEAPGGSLQAFVSRYLQDGQAPGLGDWKIEFLDYDWSLNDRRR